MLITGKVLKIMKEDENRNIYTVILSKSRKGKNIEIAIVFWGKHAQSIEDNRIKLNDKIDIQVYAYSKSYFYKDKERYNSYLVAESWRHYVKGKERYKEIINQKTGEVIKRKGEIISENLEMK